MDGVTGVRLRATDDDTVEDLAVEGVFVAIGHDPATGVFKGAVAMDDEGYLITAAGGTTTDVPGVFAAGDCVDKVYSASGHRRRYGLHGGARRGEVFGRHRGWRPRRRRRMMRRSRRRWA